MDNRAEKNRPRPNPDQVQQLRALTGESMMDCRKALAWAAGDMEKAKARLLDPRLHSLCLVTRARPESSSTKCMRLLHEIWQNWSDEDRIWFLNEEPIKMHHTLGRHLRNHAGMWDFPWTPVVIDGLDRAIDHPDAISQRVMAEFQQMARGFQHGSSTARVAEG